MLKYIYSEKDNRIKKVDVLKIMDRFTGTYKYITEINRENIADENEDMFPKEESIYDDYQTCKETVIKKKKILIEKYDKLLKEKENELNDYDIPEGYRYKLPEFSLEEDEILILCNYKSCDGFYFYGITNEFGKYPFRIWSKQIMNFIVETYKPNISVNRYLNSNPRNTLIKTANNAYSEEKKIESEITKMFNGAIVKYKIDKTLTDGEYLSVDIDTDEFNENTKYICMDKPVMMISENNYTAYPYPYIILTKMRGKDIYVRYTPKDDIKKIFIEVTPMKDFHDYIIEQINKSRNLIDKVTSEISDLENENEEDKEQNFPKSEKIQ